VPVLVPSQISLSDSIPEQLTCPSLKTMAYIVPALVKVIGNRTKPVLLQVTLTFMVLLVRFNKVNQKQRKKGE
jgi:hypothetical protein